MAEVEDWTTPFAFQHLFHKYIEVERKVPTRQDFAAWLRGDAAAFFIHPLLEHVGWETADRERRRKLKRAFRWRIGKFHLSSMRELDVFVRLRSVYGIPVRYHVLADVLLRVDLWHGDDLVCLYFPNPKYRDQEAGRKAPAEKFFSSASPSFCIHHVTIHRQGFGRLWVADEDSMRKLTRLLEGGRHTAVNRAG